MCDAVNSLAESACLDCGQPFLAAMKGDAKPVLVLPVVGDLGALSRGQRTGLALGVVALVLVPLALLTLLLTGTPTKTVPGNTPGTSPGVTQPGGGTGGGTGTTGDAAPIAQ
jgi:hypothetical protein